MYFSTICKNPIQVKEVGTAASDAQLCSQQNTFGPTDPHMFLGCQHYFQISNLPPVFLTKTWNHIWRKLSQSINCGRKPLGSKCQPCHRGVTWPASSGKGVKQQRSPVWAAQGTQRHGRQWGAPCTVRTCGSGQHMLANGNIHLLPHHRLPALGLKLNCLGWERAQQSINILIRTRVVIFPNKQILGLSIPFKQRSLTWLLSNPENVNLINLPIKTIRFSLWL